MEGEPRLKSNESIEKYGTNVTINLNLIRHGEKGSFKGGLTKEGYEMSREFGKERGSKAYHSDVSRTRQTAEEIAKGSEYNPRMRENLAVSGSDEWYDQYFAMVEEGGMYDETRPMQRLQFDIGRENRPNGMLSSKEISAQVANELVHFLDISKKLNNDSEVTIDLVSHTGIIEHLLIDLLDENPDTFFSEIGDGMRYLEGPEIKIVREDKENVSIEVTLDREIEQEDGTTKEVHKRAVLTEEELRELADYKHEEAE